MMAINILLADDHQMLRDGLRLMLQQHTDVHVIGEAADGQEAVRLAAELQPEIVIMDIAMPVLNGLEAARQIVKSAQRTKVLLFSLYDDSSIVRRAREAGAVGFLPKNAPLEELGRAIRRISAGGHFFGPQDAGPSEAGGAGRPTQRKALTTREREVLQLLTEGKTTRTIADLLYISTKTVETHRRRIMQKLNLHSVAELTKYAIREGITFLNQ